MNKPTPKERAKQLIEKNSGSKNMSIWIQKEIINNFKENYNVTSEYENEVLRELNR